MTSTPQLPLDVPFPEPTRAPAQTLEQKYDFDQREHAEPGTANRRERNDYWRDYGRILYSSSFRRLQGKMQMLGIEHAHFFRNRLTHSLEVAQSARAIASSLGLQTTVVAEACSLAHDIGNPPFGHAAERVLDELAAKTGGFEGNAQTLRVLRHLEKKSPQYRGLNLTIRTLLGTVKYFCRRDGENKKFIYDADYDFLRDWLERHDVAEVVSTIDVQIMDRADELAYAAHDLEDSLSLGYFSIEELLHEFQTDEKYRPAHPNLETLVKGSRTFAREASRYGAEEYSFLFRKELMSNIVGTLIRAITWDEEEGRLTFGAERLLAEGLKKLTFKLVTRRESVYLYERMGEQVVRGLFEVYSDPAFNRKLALLPPEYRVYSSEPERERNIVDFIAGMMDSYAIQQYEKFFGENSLRGFYGEYSRMKGSRPSP